MMTPEALVAQLCSDLNAAHDEIVTLQGVATTDMHKFDWPEWSSQANSIRESEKLLGRKLAKTDLWTVFPPGGADGDPA